MHTAIDDRAESIINDFKKMLTVHLALTGTCPYTSPSSNAARMSHLKHMIMRAHTIAQRYTHIYMRMSGAELENQDEHRAILRAYRQKDVDLSVQLMDDHIAIACAEFAEFLNNVQPSRDNPAMDQG